MTDDWAEFVEEFGPLVYASAWRILRHRQEAEDVAQDVFALAWSKRADHVKNMAGWLRHIAVCRALDRLRRRKPFVQFDLAFVPSTESSSNAVELAELEKTIRAAVANLPEQQSATFALRYFEEMSNREIAEHLAISPSAVSSALHAARSTLISVLAPTFHGDAK